MFQWVLVSWKIFQSTYFCAWCSLTTYFCLKICVCTSRIWFCFLLLLSRKKELPESCTQNLPSRHQLQTSQILLQVVNNKPQLAQCYHFFNTNMSSFRSATNWQGGEKRDRSVAKWNCPMTWRSKLRQDVARANYQHVNL